MTTVTAAAVEVDLAAAIDDAFGDLERRMQGRGASFAALGAAITRAGSGGKRLRPALVLRSFLALGGDPDTCPALLPVATAFEVLHTAFVIHDDVIDGDTVRRGAPNVGGDFRARAAAGGADAAQAADVGDAAAILAGDLLLHEAQRIVARSETDEDVRRRLLDVLDAAVLISAAGELADVEQTALDADGGIDLERALAASHDKTAVYTFSAPLRAGAILAGADPRTDAALEGIGARLGLAFQLVDDLIGAFGTADQTGRDAGVDLVSNRTTPLVVLAQREDTWPDVRDALAEARTGPVALSHAQRALDASGARVRLHALVHTELDAVRAGLDALPSGLARLVDELASEIERRMP